jgi:hypothetical protein
MTVYGVILAPNNIILGPHLIKDHVRHAFTKDHFESLMSIYLFKKHIKPLNVKYCKRLYCRGCQFRGSWTHTHSLFLISLHQIKKNYVFCF